LSNEFKDKKVFITGASHGQGRAVALAFAKEGADIAAFDLGKPPEFPSYPLGSTAELETLAAEIGKLGRDCLSLPGDVRQEDSVRSAVATAIKAFGRIDILFNNAGIAFYAKCWEMSEAQWDRMLDINLKGAWLTAKHVIPHMIAREGGVIINNSSIAGMRGMNRLSHYAASKWGLIGLTKSWAIELAPFGIRVNSIHPTGVNTPMNDGLAALEGTTASEIAERSAGNLLPVPWVETEDVANLVLFLASQKARYATGAQFVLDAGLLTR
jgi:SDR family mycofactocin-dependent oxidoreductase